MCINSIDIKLLFKILFNVKLYVATNLYLLECAGLKVLLWTKYSGVRADKICKKKILI